LLEKEKELTRLRTGTAARAELPLVRIEADYRFVGRTAKSVCWTCSRGASS